MNQLLNIKWFNIYISAITLALAGCSETLNPPKIEPPEPTPPRLVSTPLNDTGVTFLIDTTIAPVQYTKKAPESDTNNDLIVADINRPVIFPADNTEANFSTPWVVTIFNGPTYNGNNDEPLNSIDTPTINVTQQDANNGNDAASSLNNTDGKAGFQFTKLDRITGASLNNDSTDFGCIKDNVTKLMWENKTTPISTIALHRSTNTYSWFNPDSNSNGGDEGQANGGTCTIDGDTLSFVTSVNQSNLCGFNDWRVPTVEELRSLVDYEKPADSNMIDTQFFPEISRQSHVWSSQTSALTESDAYGFHFFRGTAQTHSKSCSTSTQSSFKSGVVLVRYTDND